MGTVYNPSLANEILELCERVAEEKAARARETVPAPAEDTVPPQSCERVSSKNLGDEDRTDEGLYDTIPAPPPSDAAAEEELVPSTIPGARLPKIAEA